MVMKVMGHTDVRTAMRYQHPILDPVREAIDQRNLRHNSRHSEVEGAMKLAGKLLKTGADERT